MERVGPNLAAEGDLLFVAGELGQRLALLLFRDLVEPRLEDPQRGVAVAKLRPLVLTLDDQPRRQVRDSDRGVRGVDSLPARSRRAEDVDTQLVLADAHLDVVDFGRHGDRGEARLTAT